MTDQTSTDTKSFDNLRFLGIQTEQADSASEKPDDQFGFLDDAAVAERQAVKEREEAAWEQSEQEDLQKWMTEEHSGIDTDGMSNSEFEKHAANLKREEKRNDNRNAERAYLKTKGEEIPDHLVDKKPLSADDLKDAPNLLSADVDIDGLSDEEFAKGIARLKQGNLDDPDAPASQVFADKFRALNTTIAELKATHFEDHTDAEIADEIREQIESGDPDEAAQQYEAATQESLTALKRAHESDASEVGKSRPDYEQAREHVLAGWRAQFKAAQPAASDVHIDRAVELQEISHLQSAINSGVSHGVGMLDLAEAGEYIDQQTRKDLHALKYVSGDKLTSRQRTLMDMSFKANVGESNIDRMKPGAFNSFYNGWRAKEKGLDVGGVSELFSSIGT